MRKRELVVLLLLSVAVYVLLFFLMVDGLVCTTSGLTFLSFFFAARSNYTARWE